MYHPSQLGGFRFSIQGRRATYSPEVCRSCINRHNSVDSISPCKDGEQHIPPRFADHVSTVTTRWIPFLHQKTETNGFVRSLSIGLSLSDYRYTLYTYTNLIISAGVKDGPYHNKETESFHLSLECVAASFLVEHHTVRALWGSSE